MPTASDRAGRGDLDAGAVRRRRGEAACLRGGDADATPDEARAPASPPKRKHDDLVESATARRRRSTAPSRFSVAATGGDDCGRRGGAAPSSRTASATASTDALIPDKATHVGPRGYDAARRRGRGWRCSRAVVEALRRLLNESD